MTKKSFKGGGLSSLIGEKPQVKKELTIENAQKFLEEFNQEPKPKREINKSSQIGTKDTETRATFIIAEELQDKLKAIAYWDRVLIKDVVTTALEEYVVAKKVKPRPEEVRIKDQEQNQRMLKKPGYKARLPKY